MSLKDEIDKLIAAKRALLDKQDAKNREVNELQKTRFSPIRSALQELSKAVDPAYLQIQLGDSYATVKAGRHRNNSFEDDTRWEIQPKSSFRLGAGEQPQPGFSIKEVNTYREPEYDRIEQTYTFNTEAEAI